MEKSTKTSKKPTTKAKAVKVASKPVSASKNKAVAKESVKKASPKKVAVNVETPTRFAVIEIAGTQLKVTEGGKYEIAKLPQEKGESFDIENVLMMVDGDDIKVGDPYLKGAKVNVEIDSQKKDKKIRVFKYKSKSRYRKTTGHRAEITRIVVKSIKA